MPSHRAALAVLLACAGCRERPAPAPAASASVVPTASATATAVATSAPETVDAGRAPEIAEGDGGICSKRSRARIHLGERTRVEREVRYAIAGSDVWICLMWSGYPLVSQPEGRHRHMLAATFEVGDGKDETSYRLTGNEYFRYRRIEVRYEADGPLRHTMPIDIAVTVTPVPGGPVDL